MRNKCPVHSVDTMCTSRSFCALLVRKGRVGVGSKRNRLCIRDCSRALIAISFPLFSAIDGYAHMRVHVLTRMCFQRCCVFGVHARVRVRILVWVRACARVHLRARMHIHTRTRKQSERARLPFGDPRASAMVIALPRAAQTNGSPGNASSELFHGVGL